MHAWICAHFCIICLFHKTTAHLLFLFFTQSWMCMWEWLSTICFVEWNDELDVCVLNCFTTQALGSWMDEYFAHVQGFVKLQCAFSYHVKVKASTNYLWDKSCLYCWGKFNIPIISLIAFVSFDFCWFVMYCLHIETLNCHKCNTWV